MQYKTKIGAKPFTIICVKIEVLKLQNIKFKKKCARN